MMRVRRPGRVPWLIQSGSHRDELGEGSGLLRRIGFEMRVTCTWTWLLPLVGAVLALIDVAHSAEPPDTHLLALRTILEVGTPLAGVLLVAPLLEREWIQGTLAQTALRTPLIALLALRVLLAIGYLLSLAVLAAAVGLASAPPPHVSESTSVWQWVGAIALATLAPTLALMALTLLITHATVSAIAGYVIGVGAWLGCFIAALVLPQDSITRDFLLFGWSYSPLPSFPGWMAGKLVLLVGGLLLFLPQLVLLRGEARLIRNTAE
jgi:hypothetical protein